MYGQMAGTAVDSKCSVVTVSMDIYSALVLFCPCFKFYFPMYITKRLPDITIPTKQRKIKLEPGIKLNLNIYRSERICKKLSYVQTILESFS